MIKWWDPLTILGKFCNVKKWMGRPKEVTVKNLVGRREYYLCLATLDLIISFIYCTVSFLAGSMVHLYASLLSDIFQSIGFN